MSPASDPLAVFVPDGPPASAPLWEEEAHPWSPALVGHYLAAIDTAHALVLDPFARHPAVAAAAVNVGHRVLAINLDPTRLLALRLSLSPPEPRVVDMGFSTLADSLKGNEPLSRHLSDLYLTVCPHCGERTTADYFIWDGDAAMPVEKWVRCPSCNAAGLSPVTAEDRHILEQVEPRGAFYWQLLGRLVAPQDILSERAAQLVALYTPRNRYALTELTLRAEALVDDAATLRAVRGLLLACLERCHSLSPPGAPDRPARPARLRPPRRFVERNVWKAFVESHRALRTRAPTTDVSWASGLRALLEAGTPLVLSQQATARALARALPPGAVDLVMTEPPRPDPAEYALAFLWTGWLFGREATGPLRSLAVLRSTDWDWYAEATGGVFSALRETLRPGGKVILACNARDDQMLPALLRASADAGLRLDAAVARPGPAPVAHRLVFSAAPRGSHPLPSSLADRNRVGREAVLDTLRRLGQPAEGKVLAWTVLWAWSQQGTIKALPGGESPTTPPTQQAEPADLLAEAAAVLVPDEDLTMVVPAKESQHATNSPLEAAWWLAHPAQADPPLADRVDSFVYDDLCQGEGQSEEDLATATYAAFPGILTPSLGLIRASLASYAIEEPPGTWRLRPEDVPASRAAEQGEIVALLLALGRRLGYDVRPVGPDDARWQPCRVIWLDEGRPARGFIIQTSAAISPLLAAPGSAPALMARHGLIPGGRAALVAYKLQQVPGWAEMVAGQGWQFIKNRHLRRLASLADLDRAGFAARLGLDPIGEQPETQLSLF
ncbi:MAG: hypothetical protein IT330_15975 [Anaerolineae bacterium]|nr:hypothetical protein [Anaerolineae bacterium]